MDANILDIEKQLRGIDYLAKTAELHCLLEAKRAMCRCTCIIVKKRVRGEFRTFLLSRPRFGRMHERSANAATSRFWNHVPAFQVGHAIRNAVLGIRTE